MPYRRRPHGRVADGLGAGKLALVALLLLAPPLSARADDDADGFDDNREAAIVEVVDGLTNLVIGPADQRRFGLKTTPATPHRVVLESGVRGRVLAVTELAALKAALVESESEQQTLDAAVAGQVALVERVAEMRTQGLAVDPTQLHRERQVLAQLRGRSRAGRLRSKGLRQRAVREWGERLGRAVGEETDAVLDDILERRRHLLISEAPVPDEDVARATIMIDPSGNRATATPAELLGPAVAAFGVRGRSYFLLAADPDLRAGMRLSVWFGGEDKAIHGHLVPRSALVWYAGHQWLYVQLETDRFERRRVVAARSRGEQVFLEQGIRDDEVVVVTGAPSLLGEEFRWSIPDEDDD